MKFALINGSKELPTPKAEGICPCCEAKVISKCGDIKLWHWAHYSKRNCDTWWENETQWHRDWKNFFPIEWQEVIHQADDGEKHIADVKTEHNCVLEFQHSFISKEERESRNDFYSNIVWVVDGLRRKRDKDQFFKALASGVQVIPSPLLVKIYTDESRIIQEWSDSKESVFIDFGDEQRIWWLLPIKDDGWSYVVPFSRQEFIKFNLGKMNIDFVSFLKNCLREYALFFQQRQKSRNRQTVPMFPTKAKYYSRYNPRKRSRRL